MTLSARDIAEALERHGLAPTKALGQNFVVDPNTVRRIARLAEVGPGDRVVEIGAGLGSLTLALVETGAEVTAVEVDRGVVPVLRDHLADHDVRIIEADALTVDWDDVLPGDGWVLVANLPYNVGTPLLADLLEHVGRIERFLVMVQLEVAERLVARPGDQARGALSVKVEARADARLVGRVGPNVFLPKPSVDSALVDLRRRDRPVLAGVDLEVLSSVVERAFGQRRKMLRRSLGGLLDADRIEAAGVDPRQRPEQLSLVEWARLASAVAR
ncbi:MAG: 16S rRNA (adenine(1518)-N(6)/adenine(1519)-N(6))-dimethyltransferase RsmA [Actinomycetota bacterium]